MVSLAGPVLTDQCSSTQVTHLIPAIHPSCLRPCKTSSLDLISLLASEEATSPGLTSAVPAIARRREHQWLTVSKKTSSGLFQQTASSSAQTRITISNGRPLIKEFGLMVILACTPFSTFLPLTLWSPSYISTVLWNNSSQESESTIPS